MTLFLSAEGDDAGLLAEMSRIEPAVAGRIERPGLVAVERFPDGGSVFALARQTLLEAEPLTAPSVTAWARNIFGRVQGVLPDGQPWHLHVFAHYGVKPSMRMGARAWYTARRDVGPRPMAPLADPQPSVVARAGEHRCALIRAAVLEGLRDRRRHLLKSLRAVPTRFTPADSLVQVCLTSPEAGWISVVRAPGPFLSRQRLSPFPKGDVPVAADPAAPSRAFAKLVEAELRLGHRIATEESCVDLGAAPGGWSYVALQRGARVLAVDRSPLREDLMRDARLTFVRGDAFTFEPRPTDWLLCDVIAAPERSIELILNWLRGRHCRRFMVTIKLRGAADHPKLDRLKNELPHLASDWFVTHLSANKGEACVFGQG